MYDKSDCGPNEIWGKPKEEPKPKRVSRWPKAEIYIVLLAIAGGYLLWLALTAYPFVKQETLAP